MIIGTIYKLFGPINLVFERILPITVLAFLLAAQILISQFIFSKGALGKTSRKLTSDYVKFLLTNLEGHLDKPIGWLHLKSGPIWFLAILNSLILIITSLRYDLPLGFAGLYTLFSEEIIRNNFVLPYTIPYYGPGGISASYPPFGMILMGFIIVTTKIPALTYLQFAPHIFYFIASILFFLLTFKYSKSKSAAILSSFLFVTNANNFELHSTSGGIIRGLALCLLFAGLLFTYISVTNKEIKVSLLAGLFFGLTITTHLAYAFVFGIILFIVMLFNCTNKKQWIVFILIGLTGLIVSSPWWVLVIKRHGFQVFLSAFQSHGNTTILEIMEGNIPFVTVMISNLKSYFHNWLFGLLGIIGLIHEIVKKRFVMAILFVVFMINGENNRFIFFIAAINAGLLLVRVGRRFKYFKKTNLIPLSGLIFILLNILVISKSELSRILEIKPLFSRELITLGDEIQKTTKSEDSFLILADIPNQGEEWFPYFLRRTPSIGSWGSEWTDNTEIIMVESEINSCIQKKSLSCVKNILLIYDILPDYLISYVSDTEFNEQIVEDKNWISIFVNQDFILWTSYEVGL